MKYFWTEQQRKARKTTCCFEFQQGPYRARHWLPDSIYLHADVFDELGLYELFVQAVPGFNYYYVTEMTAAQCGTLVGMARQKGGPAAELAEELAQWAAEVYCTYAVITVCGI